MNLLQAFGILLILNAFVIVTIYHTTQKPEGYHHVWLCGLAVMAGFVLLLLDRITEISNPILGSLKAAKEQAIADVKEISEIKTKVEGFGAVVDEYREKLKSLEKSQKDAESSIANIQVILDMTSVYSRVQNDDRQAFDQIEKWVEDKSFRYRAEVEKTYWSIINAHNPPAQFRAIAGIPWAKGIDPNKVSIENISKEYKAANTNVRLALQEHVSTRADFPKKAKLEFFMSAIESEMSLEGLEWASRHFNQIAGLNTKALIIKPLKEWWSQNKDKIQD